MDAGQIEVMDDAVAEVLRQKTFAERIHLASNCHRILCLLVRRRHPEWDASRVSRSVLRRARSREFPLRIEDILTLCEREAGRELAAQWAEELGFKEMWDLDFVQRKIAVIA